MSNQNFLKTKLLVYTLICWNCFDKNSSRYTLADTFENTMCKLSEKIINRRNNKTYWFFFWNLFLFVNTSKDLHTDFLNAYAWFLTYNDINHRQDHVYAQSTVRVNIFAWNQRCHWRFIFFVSQATVGNPAAFLPKIMKSCVFSSLPFLKINSLR